jgi:predicted GIY-YIG superfamily endonuclease
MTPQALYRFFDAKGSLLYVGISLNPGARWKQHRADKPWWTEVANVTVEHHPDRQSVMDAEREAIKRERPRYNRLHKSTDLGCGRLGRLLRVPDQQERFKATCWLCGYVRLPTELHPDDAGWAAVYECCDESWAVTIARAA